MFVRFLLIEKASEKLLIIEVATQREGGFFGFYKTKLSFQEASKFLKKENDLQDEGKWNEYINEFDSSLSKFNS